MGKIYDRIDPKLQELIEAQPVFFVATAPNDPNGHVNVSPKGVPGTFAVLDASTFAYLDLTGSGAETIAHVRENGRITIMFCTFDGQPKIVRLHGRGRVVSLHNEDFDEFASRFKDPGGARAVMVVDVHRVSDSCGFGVPLMTYGGERELLGANMDRKGIDGQADYRRRKNRLSIDGLPAFDYDLE